MSVYPVMAVKDYEASKKFYTEKLGFTLEFEMPGDQAFGSFAIGKARLMLGSYGEGGVGKGLDLMLLPEEDSFDVDKHYELLKGRGVNITKHIVTEPWGDRVFSIQDPDGWTLTFAKTVEVVQADEAIERIKAQNA